MMTCAAFIDLLQRVTTRDRSSYPTSWLTDCGLERVEPSLFASIAKSDRAKARRHPSAHPAAGEASRSRKTSTAQHTF